MTGTSGSQMGREVREIPSVVAKLLTDGREPIRDVAYAARARDPAMIVTVARGSSDHACTYFKYAAELALGLPVASIGPSVASIYGARLKLGQALAVAVSQSGKSPDIVEMMRAAGEGGALTVAVTNNPASPLAGASRRAIDIMAGPELSVAATKTYVASVVTLLALIADWRQDRRLSRALEGLPDALSRAAEFDWPDLRAALQGHDSLFTLGRGPAFAIASESALKFKEICMLHAESYSSAEVLHGPVSIVDPGFPVLALVAADAAEPSVRAIAENIAAKGARVFLTGDSMGGEAGGVTSLPAVRTGHPLTDPLALVVSFYAMIEQLALGRGIDPDRPRHLRKVTETR